MTDPLLHGRARTITAVALSVVTCIGLLLIALLSLLGIITIVTVALALEGEGGHIGSGYVLPLLFVILAFIASLVGMVLAPRRILRIAGVRIF